MPAPPGTPRVLPFRPMVRMEDVFAATLFILVAGGILAAAAWETLGLLRERFRKAPAPRSPLRWWWRRGILAAGLLGVMCISWGYFVEPFWPETTHTRIESPVLPKGSGPVRIVHLTDMHCDAKPRLEERLLALVAAEKPDLIVFTGDSVNSPEGLPLFRRTMTALAQIAPTFAVKGNWDTHRMIALDRWGGTGVVELDGNTALLQVHGAPVRVCGVSYDHDGRAAAALARTSPAEFRIFLYHTPDLAEELVGLGANLCLAGHTHGGQIALPFLGPIITLTKTGRRYARGLHAVGTGWLYTSRGIGMEGGMMPRVRFLARPEITVIDVVPR